MKAFVLLLSGVVQLTLAQAPKELKPIIEVMGTDSGAGLGGYAKGVGDLNKDGYADVAVSAVGKRVTYLYYGGRPMSQTAAKVFYGGGRTASGDFNGDGWRDLAIEVWFRDTVLIYFGGLQIDTIPDLILTGEHKGDLFGYRGLSSIDLNGDGFHDLIVGAVFYNADSAAYEARGKIYVFRGGTHLDTIPSTYFLGDSAWSRLGFDVAVGDINNDGWKDIVALGWHQHSTSSINYDYFYMKVFMNKGNFVFEQQYYIDSRHTPGGFLDHVESFDADGDNIDDILVSGIYIFKGGAQLDTVPTYHVPPPYNDTATYGTHPWVGGGGDYNRDGVKDVLLSTTQGYFGGAPGVRVYLGKKGKEPQFVAYRSYPACCADPLLGKPENAGDVNGDGIDDIILGTSGAGFPNAKGLFGIYSGDTSLVTAVEAPPEDSPTESDLKQNYPNPFNPETTIEYLISERGRVVLKIYDNLGKEVKTLANEVQNAGTYNTHWDGTDSEGRRLPSGVYYYRLTTPKNSEVKKTILLK